MIKPGGILVSAVQPPSEEQAQAAGSAFICGACEEVVLTGRESSDLRDVVVKCRCGEFNQL